jgi:hypothetical protein
VFTEASGPPRMTIVWFSKYDYRYHIASLDVATMHVQHIMQAEMKVLYTDHLIGHWSLKLLAWVTLAEPVMFSGDSEDDLIPDSSRCAQSGATMVRAKPRQ